MEEAYDKGYKQALVDAREAVNLLRGGSDPWEDALDSVQEKLGELWID